MPPTPSLSPEYHIHEGEGVYGRLKEIYDIPSETLSALGNSAIKAKELAYCKCLSQIHWAPDLLWFHRFEDSVVIVVAVVHFPALLKIGPRFHFDMASSFLSLCLLCHRFLNYTIWMLVSPFWHWGLGTEGDGL